MIISRGRGYIFVHIPKTGGTAMALALEDRAKADDILIGDTPKVAFDHYGREWGQHYQDPLWAAIGDGPKPRRKKKQPGTSRRKTPKASRRKSTGRKPSKQRRNEQ